MIVETLSNELFRVEELPAPELSHVWLGVPVKKIRTSVKDDHNGDRYEPKKNARERLIRRAGCRVVCDRT